MKTFPDEGQKAKIIKKDSQSYGYWMAACRKGGKTRNVHRESCVKMDGEAARQKARKNKAGALGIFWL